MIKIQLMPPKIRNCYIISNLYADEKHDYSKILHSHGT